MTFETNGRRKFLKKSAAILGVAASPAVLAACSSATNTPIPAATVAPTVPVPTATIAPAATNTAVPAPTTAAPKPTTAVAAATTAPAAATTAASATTAAAGGAAPAGYDPVGATADYPEGSNPKAFKVNSVSGFVINTGGKYSVYSDICTHQGCQIILEAAAKKFTCPCHGSEFDFVGKKTKGPATADLPAFQFSIVGSTLYAKLK